MFNITQQCTGLNTLLWSNITNFSLKGIKVEQLVTYLWKSNLYRPFS